ncbi:MAG: molecular chaperone DnaJ, partial [Clostridia bacterium]|nr:molecular chaperone DnaJ [Clostridia bacterium]
MAQKDYYAILGVSKTATDDEIKSAYRKMAKKYHPDLHPNDNEAAEKFKECNEAYSVLGDAQKRKSYDRGEYDMGMGGAGGFNPFGGGGFSATGFDDIFDMFSDFMGGGRTSRGARSAHAQGSDISYRLHLTFAEAALGCKKQINFTRVERCSTCHGTGAKSEQHQKTCDKCNGTGRVQVVTNTIFGRSVSVGVCDKCGGSGKIVTEKCRTCNGKGVVNVNKVMNVTIPAGVENGAVLQIAGEGNSPAGSGRNGSLLLVISVENSKLFKRENLSLFCDVPITFAKAVNGGEIEIPSLQGIFIHKIAPGTANGETFRFRGKGISTTRGSGDLYATVHIEVPKSASRDQLKKLEEFER